MGQARNTKHLTQIGGELNLGTAQHKGCQQSAAPPPGEILKPDRNPSAEISDRGPASVQQIEAGAGQTTPTAPRRQPFGRSIQQRMRTG